MVLPLVSLVTPSFNQAAFLEDTLRSVLEQDYPNLEYIVIDGGSNDGSVEIIQHYASRLAYWVSEPDRGQAHAINKGLSWASGELVGWLNSDDILLPGAINRIVQTFEEKPSVDVVYGRLQRIDEQGNPVPTPLLPKDHQVFSAENVLAGCVVNQPGCLWRRAMTEKAGLLDENLNYVMDYEYWARILLSGARFYRIPDEVAAFRLSSGSKTVSQSERMALEMLAVIDRLVARPDLPALLALPPDVLRRQARHGRALGCLTAFYGAWKQKRHLPAMKWLASALLSNPLVLFERRWFDLALARFKRRQREI